MDTMDAQWKPNQQMAPPIQTNAPVICKPQPLYPNMPRKSGYLHRPPTLPVNLTKAPTTMSSAVQHAHMGRFLPAFKMAAIPPRVPPTSQAYPQCLPRIMPLPPTVPRVMAPRQVTYPPTSGHHSASGIGYIPHYIITPKYPSGKKLFRCPQCRYITDRKNNLKRHIGTMHQDCGKILECCDVIFPSKASLRDHIVLFHRSGYKCRYCGRNFCRKALLKRHLVVHNGQKDFVCTICDYGTNDSRHMEEHKKMHHLKIQLDDSCRPARNEVNLGGFGHLGWHAMYWNLLGLDTNGDSWIKSYSPQVGGQARSHTSMFPDRLKATHCMDNNANDISLSTCKDLASEEECIDDESIPMSRGSHFSTKNDKLDTKNDMPKTAPNRICTFPYKCSSCAKTFLQQRNFIEHANSCIKARPEPRRPLKFFMEPSLSRFDYLDVKQPADDPDCLDTLALIRNLEQEGEEDIDIEEEEPEGALDLSISGDRNNREEALNDRMIYNLSKG